MTKTLLGHNNDTQTQNYLLQYDKKYNNFFRFRQKNKNKKNIANVLSCGGQRWLILK